MRKEVIKKIALVGIMTALYVVMSLTLKIPIGVGNIQLDMGYIVLAIACFTVGPWAGFIGGAGAAIESILFSAYGISWGWIAMNLLIGLVLGFIFIKYELTPVYRFIMAIDFIILAVLVGALVKTVIECALYSIPYQVKIPKSLTAWVIDSIAMIIGLSLVKPVKKAISRK